MFTTNMQRLWEYPIILMRRYIVIGLCLLMMTSWHDAVALVYPADVTFTTIPILNYLRPEYRMPVVDPAFKTKITRVTDSAVMPSSTLQHHYSKTQPWNCDSSLIMISGSYLLDGNTYEIIGRYFAPSAECQWSHTDPHKMYSFVPATKAFVSLLIYQDANGCWTSSVTPIYTFTGYDEMFMGRFEGAFSWDDRYVALMGRPTGSNDLDLIVLDTQALTHSKITCSSMWTAGQLPKMDWCGVSPSGNYVIAAWVEAGSSLYNGVQVYDRGSLIWQRQLAPKTEHGDLGYDNSNPRNEVFVHVVCGSYYKLLYDAGVVAWRLNDGGKIQVLPWQNAFGGHVSCRNYRRPGWCYVTSESRYFECMSIKIDGSHTIERFAHHHSDSTPYAAEAKGVPDPDGTKFMFVSNWNNPTGYTPDTTPYSYVAEYPQSPPIQLLPNENAPTEVVLSSATAKLSFRRQIWQSMWATTPLGNEIAITDLFFYITYDAGIGGPYWTDPTVWDTCLSFEILPPLNGGHSIRIIGERAGFVKQICATVYPDDPAIYVVNRLSTTIPRNSVVDLQMIYMVNTPMDSPRYLSQLVLDTPSERDLSQIAFGSSYACLRLPNENATVALLCAPLSQQNLKAAGPLFYWPNGTAREMRIRSIDYQPLNPGEVVELRYVIYWNDGDKLSQVQGFADLLQSGAFNEKFRSQ